MAKPWPKTWEHKETKRRVQVMPWWECVDPIVASDGDFGAADVGTEVSEGRLGFGLAARASAVRAVV